MPYVGQEVRRRLSRDGFALKTVDNLAALGESLETPGQLNYAVTKLCLGYLLEVPSYGTLNDVIGVLECVKLEFYRRAVVPYEDEKIAENGDVY